MTAIIQRTLRGELADHLGSAAARHITGATGDPVAARSGTRYDRMVAAMRALAPTAGTLPPEVLWRTLDSLGVSLNAFHDVCLASETGNHPRFMASVRKATRGDR